MPCHAGGRHCQQSTADLPWQALLAAQAVFVECLQGSLPAADSEAELVADEPPARRSKAPAHAVRRSGGVAKRSAPDDEEEVVQVLQVGSALY